MATDLDGKVTYWNRAAEALYGWQASEVLGRNVVDVTPSSASREQAKAIVDSLQDGASWTGEFLVQRKDGTSFPVQVTDYPVYDQDGRLTGIIGISADISERKRMEEELRQAHDELELRVRLRTAELEHAKVRLEAEVLDHERAATELSRSRELLAKTFSSLRDAVFVLDCSARILDCNPAASTLFGYTHEEMLGQTTLILHVDERALAEFRQCLYPAVEEYGFLHLPEFRMRRRDGTAFTTEHTVTPLLDGTGQQVGWVSVVRDITERKQAEEELRQSEERFRLIATCSPDTMFYQDRQLRHLWIVNPISPLSEDGIVGRTDGDVFSPEEARHLATLKERVLSFGTTEQAELRMNIGGREGY